MRLATLSSLTTVALLLCAAPSAIAGELIGPESCRTCHAEAYRIWAQSPHARASDALTGTERTSPLCLQCHSRDEARSGAAQVTGVSCETCHGGGRYYQPAIVMRDHELARLFGLADLTAASAGPLCLSCHGGEQQLLSGPFDLKARLAQIDHWTADREARSKEARAPRSPLGRWLAAR
jgi:Cytochrome c554 and c-prime